MHVRVLLSLTLLLGACASFQEDHYFQRTSKATGKPVNFYRLRVRGAARFSGAKYIAGYYDERAVDLFFNELKLASGKEDRTVELFRDDAKEPGTDTVIKPLSPDAEHGTFVMLLSTDASAVADAIGQFAENQVVADAITNIVNRDLLLELAEAETTPSFERARASASASEIAGLYELLSDSLLAEGRQPGEAETRRALLRVLNSIARAQGGFTPFEDFETAAAWFASVRQGS